MNPKSEGKVVEEQERVHPGRFGSIPSLFETLLKGKIPSTRFLLVTPPRSKFKIMNIGGIYESRKELRNKDMCLGPEEIKERTEGAASPSPSLLNLNFKMNPSYI